MPYISRRVDRVSVCIYVRVVGGWIPTLIFAFFSPFPLSYIMHTYRLHGRCSPLPITKRTNVKQEMSNDEGPKKRKRKKEKRGTYVRKYSTDGQPASQKGGAWGPMPASYHGRSATMFPAARCRHRAGQG